jgi:hypothetical protein
MFPRQRWHAVRSVHAEDEPLDARGQPFAGLPAEDVPLRAMEPFAGLLADPPRSRRVAAMALLGVAGATVAFMVAHGLRASGVGGPHPATVAGPAVVAPQGHGVSAKSAEGVVRHAPRLRSGVPARSVEQRHGVGQRHRMGQRHTQARSVPEARGAGIVPAAHEAVSSPAATAGAVAGTGAAGSEFNFER